MHFSQDALRASFFSAVRTRIIMLSPFLCSGSMITQLSSCPLLLLNFHTFNLQANMPKPCPRQCSPHSFDWYFRFLHADIVVFWLSCQHWTKIHRRVYRSRILYALQMSQPWLRSHR
ncbi:hypothetical protein BX666DRAFT_2047543 [Dichotomocladium elegans]|nr:hypothetical protein BX666DRAFT_2047543 [Dichotomocladium elegans]